MTSSKALAFVSLALVLMFGLAGPAQAATIMGGTVDVGMADNLVGTLLNNSHPCIAVGGSINGGNHDAEECWGEDVLGGPLTFTTKNEDVTAYLTDVPNVIAFPLASTPGYYILKNATDRALFENVADLNWGVVNVSEIDGGVGEFNLNDLFISHVTEFNGVAVPEPSTLLLLGTGLAMVGLKRRRNK
jgi:hypothetical protein